MRQVYFFLLIIVFISGLSACIGNNKGKQPQLPETNYFIHRVVGKPETIKEIAKWYSGKADNWRLIASANPFLETQRLRTGDLVLIPPQLVINTKPFPKPKNNQRKTQSSRQPNNENRNTLETAEEIPVETVDLSINAASEATPVVAAPSQEVTAVVESVPTPEPTIAAPLAAELSIDQMIAEEQKALELLKNELNQ